MTPNSTGMMARKPLKATEPTTVTARVNMETRTLSMLMFSPVSPAMEAAVGASSRPMTAMMEPMAAGGKMTSIHLVPTARMMSEKRMNSRPNTMKPDCAEEYPLVAMMASTGEMKAKLEPR